MLATESIEQLNTENKLSKKGIVPCSKPMTYQIRSCFEITIVAEFKSPITVEATTRTSNKPSAKTHVAPPRLKKTQRSLIVVT